MVYEEAQYSVDCDEILINLLTKKVDFTYHEKPDFAVYLWTGIDNTFWITVLLIPSLMLFNIVNVNNVFTNSYVSLLTLIIIYFIFSSVVDYLFKTKLNSFNSSLYLSFCRKMKIHRSENTITTTTKEQKVWFDHPFFGVEWESFGEYQECLDKIKFIHSDQDGNEDGKACLELSYSRVPKTGYLKVIVY